ALAISIALSNICAPMMKRSSLDRAMISSRTIRSICGVVSVISDIPSLNYPAPVHASSAANSWRHSPSRAGSSRRLVEFQSAHPWRDRNYHVDVAGHARLRVVIHRHGSCEHVRDAPLLEPLRNVADDIDLVHSLICRFKLSAISSQPSTVFKSLLGGAFT